MTEDIKKKKRLKNNFSNTYNEKPTKEELTIVKYLRSKLPAKEGKLAHMVVSIFDGNDAVNLLMSSKWATGSNKCPVLFFNRHSVVEFMKQMMLKNIFHRAVKVKKKSKKKEEKSSSGKKKTTASDQPEDLSSKVAVTIAKDSKKKSPKGSKKARMKLEFHEMQTFNPDDKDGDDVYVWIYEPFSPWKFLLGGLVLLVILGFCLFPIWPPQMRSVAYYGSIGCMGVLGVLIALAVIRALLFALIWLITFGRHHFWLLPNLTEDCGVLESFRPLYHYENKGANGKSKRLKSSKENGFDNGFAISNETKSLDNNDSVMLDEKKSQ